MKTKMTTRELTLASILTAIVFVLQYFGCVIKFGTFSISTVLIPIVIGAAVCGTWVAAWLGFVFGIAVLVSGDAAIFLAVSVWGTVLTVLLKGIGCGFASGLTYKAMRKIGGVYLSVMVSAIVCPIVNTGIFLLGCRLFFMDTVSQIALSAGWEGSIAQFMIIAFVGVNFLVEMGINIFLSPIVVRLLQIKK
ncbi:MAG: ECF transporter S component [Clostridia bacterium]|nr:ECF transporter S component [Clostridia bacterium]MBQ7751880.1 ECF transporter S component [Clostridia bacterium]